MPKPLVPIAGNTRFLDYLLQNFARHGVEHVVLLAGHLGHLVAGLAVGDVAADAGEKRVRAVADEAVDVGDEPARIDGGLDRGGRADVGGCDVDASRGREPATGPEPRGGLRRQPRG